MCSTGLCASATMESGATPRRFPRLIVAVIVLLGLVGSAVVSLGLHFRNTPEFREYLKGQPVSADELARRWPDSGLLGQGAEWHEGDVDPFSVAKDDARLLPQSVRITTRVLHGEELLAEVLQELAVAAERAGGDRRGIGVRTTLVSCDADMRVLARVWIHGEPRLGPGSDKQGMATFDVIVLAGAGEPGFSVASAPQALLAKLEESSRTGLGNAISDWTNPAGSVEPVGLVHQLRRPIWLTSDDTPGGASLGRSDLQHECSTREYSFTIEQRIEHSASTFTVSRSETRTFGGKVW